MTKDIVVDYDNTIILHNGSNVVDEGVPNLELISELNRLHDLGYRILIFTSRGHLSAASRVDAEIKYRACIEKVLADYGLKYDLLSFNKPYACIYIDDSAIRQDEISRLKELN